MHTFLLLLVIACGAPAEPGGGEPPASGAAGVRADIALDAFHEAHAGGVAVLDVRTPQEFASGHVPGAVNKPLGTFDDDDPWLATLDRDAPLYVICQSGGRSARAADQLAAAGFHAVNVTGGTGGWVSKGWPVEK